VVVFTAPLGPREAVDAAERDGEVQVVHEDDLAVPARQAMRLDGVFHVFARLLTQMSVNRGTHVKACSGATGGVERSALTRRLWLARSSAATPRLRRSRPPRLEPW
jgi:hypothetical protein